MFGRDIASGAIWITVEMVAGQGTSLIVFACLAHLLSPRDFGLVAISLALIFSLKSLLIDQSITPVIRKVKAADIEYTTAFWINIVLGVLSIGVLMLFSRWADQVFKAPGLGQVMRPMSLMLVGFSLSRTQEAWLGRHFQFRVLAIRTIIGVAVGAAAGITAALMHLGVWALVIQQLVASATSVVLLWSTTIWRPGRRISLASVREILAFTFGISGNAALTIFNQNADTALIGLCFGPDLVGVYNVGKRLRLALQMIAIGPINGVTLPALSETQDDRLRIQRVFLVASRLVFTVCAPAFLGASAISGPLVGLLFGARWAPAAGVFSWLAVGGLFAVASVYASNVLLMQQRVTRLTMIAVAQTGLSLTLFAGLYAFGYKALAAPFVLPYVVTTPFFILPGLKSLGLSLRSWLESVGPPLAAAIGMAIVVSLIMRATPMLSSPSRLLLGIPVGVVVYAALLYAASPGDARRTLSDLRGRRALG